MDPGKWVTGPLPGVLSLDLMVRMMGGNAPQGSETRMLLLQSAAVVTGGD